MRRILGPTGAPQIIAPITVNQAPLLDFTSIASQRALRGRTLYLDLWVYLPNGTGGGGIAPAAYPAFWNAMQGETQLDAQHACVFLANKNNLSDAVLSTSTHRVIGEMKLNPATASEGGTLGGPQPSPSWLNDYGPAHVLQRYPLSGGVAVWLLHNYQNLVDDRQVYVWGYYTIEDEGDVDLLSRSLQPNANQAVVQYIPPTVLSTGDAVDLHEVTSELIDEVTLEYSLTGQNFTATGANDRALPFPTATHKIEFVDAGISMPMWAGGDRTLTALCTCRRDSFWRPLFNGIPMKGAGKIRLVRDVQATAVLRSTARGSFVRY